MGSRTNKSNNNNPILRSGKGNTNNSGKDNSGKDKSGKESKNKNDDSEAGAPMKNHEPSTGIVIKGLAGIQEYRGRYNNVNNSNAKGGAKGGAKGNSNATGVALANDRYVSINNGKLVISSLPLKGDNVTRSSGACNDRGAIRGGFQNRGRGQIKNEPMINRGRGGMYSDQINRGRGGMYSDQINRGRGGMYSDQINVRPSFERGYENERGRVMYRGINRENKPYMRTRGARGKSRGGGHINKCTAAGPIPTREWDAGKDIKCVASETPPTREWDAGKDIKCFASETPPTREWDMGKNSACAAAGSPVRQRKRDKGIKQTSKDECIEDETQESDYLVQNSENLNDEYDNCCYDEDCTESDEIIDVCSEVLNDICDRVATGKDDCI